MTTPSPEDLATIRTSQLFDADWYLERYPDVRALGLDAAEHYLWLGARLNRHPSQGFDGAGYFETNPDVAGGGHNPLLHYLKWGKSERRAIFPVAAGQGNAASENPQVPSHQRAVPRVIYESHNLKLQGAPSSLFEIAAGVKARRRFHPTLVSGSMGPIAHLAERHGVECVTHSIPASRITSRRHGEELVQRLASFYTRMQAALVHVNTLQNFHCIKAARYAGIPCIWNVRESEAPDSYYDDLDRDVRDLAYSAFADANAVVFVADATRRLWRARLDGVVESVTISNGIDIGRMMRSVYGTSRPAVRASLGLSDEDVVLLSVGTVTERKAQLELVDAVRGLDEAARRRLVLAVVGFNGSEYSCHVADRIRELEADGLRLIAVEESASEEDRARVAELYLAADIFVLTSRIESYPRVTLEAMHFGLPIVSTPCFGVCEQLVDGQSALFYDYGDTGKLSQLIRRLCDDAELRRAFAAAARDRLKQLNSYDGMLDGYEALYMRVMASQGQRAPVGSGG